MSSRLVNQYSVSHRPRRLHIPRPNITNGPTLPTLPRLRILLKSLHGLFNLTPQVPTHKRLLRHFLPTPLTIPPQSIQIPLSPRLLDNRTAQQVDGRSARSRSRAWYAPPWCQMDACAVGRRDRCSYSRSILYSFTFVYLMHHRVDQGDLVERKPFLAQSIDKVEEKRSNWSMDDE